MQNDPIARIIERTEKITLKELESMNEPQLSADEEKIKIYTVHYGNYFPVEIDSQYKTLEEAEKRVDELGGGMWEITEGEI